MPVLDRRPPLSLGMDLVRALDPAELMRAAGMTPDPWQRRVLRSEARQQLLCVTRQGGKSTTVATRAVYDLLYQPQAFTIILSPTFRQSRELFRRVIAIFHALGETVKAERETQLELELRNGGRVVALPGNGETIRSYSGATRLLIDEAGSVPDDVYLAARPFLATTGGVLQVMGTPRGRRGFFYEAWENGGGAWERTRVPAEECPRLHLDFLEREQEEMGDRWYSQEYQCFFLDTLDGLFTTAQIDAAISDEVKPLFPVR